MLRRVISCWSEMTIWFLDVRRCSLEADLRKHQRVKPQFGQYHFFFPSTNEPDTTLLLETEAEMRHCFIQSRHDQFIQINI